MISSSFLFPKSDISLFRIFRYAVACIIIFTLYANIFHVGIASAESGSFSLFQSTFINGYNLGDAGAGTISWNHLRIDTANYNAITDFYVIPNTNAMFLRESNYTFFTCVSGCAAQTQGTASYSKSGTILTWDFPANTQVVSKNLTLVYESNIFDSSNIAVNTVCGTEDAIFSAPVVLACSNGKGVRTISTETMMPGSSHVSSSSTQSYIVTYPLSGKFQIQVNKSGLLNVKDRIVNNTYVQYYIETTYNNNSFNSPAINYMNGINLSMSTSVGGYASKIINITLNQAISIGIGNVSFKNDSTYQSNDFTKQNIYFWTNLTGSNPDYVYHVDLIDPKGSIIDSMIYNNLNTSNYYLIDLPLNLAGVWKLKLYACGYGICSGNKIDLGEDEIYVFGISSDENYIYFDKRSYNIDPEIGESTLYNISYNVKDSDWDDWFTSWHIYVIDEKTKTVVNAWELSSPNGNVTGRIFPYVGKFNASLTWTTIEKSQDIAYDVVYTYTSDIQNGYRLTLSTSYDCDSNFAAVVEGSATNLFLNVINNNGSIAENISVLKSPSTIFRFLKGGWYTLMLENSTMILNSQRILVPVCTYSGAAGETPVPKSTPKSETEKASEAQSNEYWLGLVSLMGMGTGDQAKMFFSIIIITIVSLLGFKFIGGNAIIVSFGAYIWFTYIEFIPKWVFIIVVIIISSRMWR